MTTNQSKLHEKLSDLEVNDATIYAHLKMQDNSGMPDLDVAIALIRSLAHEKNSYFEQSRKLMETNVRPMVFPTEVIRKLTFWQRIKLFWRGIILLFTSFIGILTIIYKLFEVIL